ncbi:antitoxin ParD1/3/4 [Sphingomonas sp. YR710]|uniref:type II toxin-antitoxin system ParD family antitoxin n=1 Tax=Sphingomonas sp. YR710 TaxID=1882773 RepID=UPI000881C2AA|nr:type II toxin-antitoxin system ParD family antitoxin [Sphingomonas sp. YR710]SDD20928.1 antitoxin ParD1/3/4 [Sphingomonas sp. YR710]
MASMNISVPDPMRDWVQSRVDSGKYGSVSDYVRDLIRKDQTEADEKADQQRWLDAIDAAIERGLADVTAGRVHDIDTVFDALDARYANWPEARDKR